MTYLGQWSHYDIDYLSEWQPVRMWARLLNMTGAITWESAHCFRLRMYSSDSTFPPQRLCVFSMQMQAVLG